jgi:hypothetical protein
MVDEDLADTTLGDLQDGARKHSVSGVGEYIIEHSAFTVRPALHSVGRSESVNDLHAVRLS